MTTISYDPPLNRIKYEKITDLVKLAYSTAEVAEATFRPSGLSILVIRQDAFPEVYLTVTPGDEIIVNEEKRAIYIRRSSR